MPLPLKHPCWREPALCIAWHSAKFGLAKVLNVGTGKNASGRVHELRRYSLLR